MKKTEALVLFSGGLDSMLAALVLQDQAVQVTALCFWSNFYNCEKARQAVTQLNIELREYDLSAKMAELVKNPPSGYGKNLNPCVDCHSLMIKIAGEIALAEKFDFVATGEVLGQRPFSQNIRSLARVAELSGVDVLRPLSAKLLPITEMEKSGLIRRDKLLDIKGRTRDRQFELIKKYGIKEYASPSGGCLLTDPEFSERLGKMLGYWPDCSSDDIELLKHGRVEWLKTEDNRNVLLIIGRRQEDNEILVGLVKKGDIVVELEGMNGPTAVLRGLRAAGSDYKLRKLKIPESLKKSELFIAQNKTTTDIIKTAAILTGFCAVKARGQEIGFDIKIQSI
jgi:predicted subunit of tRNA(5-methylaminomethyl-2-thiouridylate) methyltransferase